MIPYLRLNQNCSKVFKFLKSKNNITSEVAILQPAQLFRHHQKAILVGNLALTRRNFSTTTPIYSADSKLKFDSNASPPNIVLPSPPPYVDEKFSYAYGRSLKELKYYAIGPLIDNICSIEPHSTAIVFYDEGVSKSFEQLNADINKLVNGLVDKLKLKRGDLVGIYSYNVYQYVVTQLACNKLGIIVSHFNPSYKAHELCNVMGKSDVKVIFMPGGNSRQCQLNDQWNIICDDSVAKLQQDGKLDKLKQIILFDGEFGESSFKLKDVKVDRWRSVFTNDSELSQEALEQTKQVISDDIYGIFYTSGTTGVPKGAIISQFTAINNSALSADRIYKERGPNFESMRGNACVPTPLFHEFSGILGLLCPMINGGSFVCPGMKYDVVSIYESIMRFRCNILFCTPTILIDFLEYVDKNNIDTSTIPLKSLLLAGSVIMPELVHRAHRELKALEEVKIGYGSSENGVIATLQTSAEDMNTKAHTCGIPLEFSEIKVVDPKTGNITELGESGELYTRGHNTMIAYHNEPEKTDDVLTICRWYKTGDLATIDKLGNLRIVGRIKDLIIKGGENIYPAEVESVIHSYDGVKDAHVFGVPDKRYVEEVSVWIKLDKKPVAGSKEEDDVKKKLIEYCKTKLAYNKVPKYIFFVDEFPLTSAKKIKKFVMRDQTIEWLKLNQ